LGYPNVRHIGHVSRWDLPPLYADADVFLFPSLVEGFAMTPLEAMASGLPVIVSANTFGSGVITDGVDGYVVPIRDVDAIVERLRQLAIAPELRREMGAAAAKRASSFTRTRYAESMVDLLAQGVGL
jgi:alpha-maltose-1-phosphate synthase